MPMAMPAPPYASAATRPRPSKNPPAPITGIFTAAAACGSKRLVGIAPVCPPPSWPCAMTASTPHSATFSACRFAPIVGIVTMPAALRRLTMSLPGACAKLATRTFSAIRMSIR